MSPSLSRRVAAEFLGTAFLVAAVVGSGIMAERLSGGNVALALLTNTIATGAALVASPLISLSQHVRHGPAQILSECVATFGLLCVIWGCSRSRPSAAPFAVGSYITAAYWFTASTSFANPAVTVERSLSDTFAGIRPADVLPFIAAQLCGGFSGILVFEWLSPRSSDGLKVRWPRL